MIDDAPDIYLLFVVMLVVQILIVAETVVPSIVKCVMYIACKTKIVPKTVLSATWKKPWHTKEQYSVKRKDYPMTTTITTKIIFME